MQSVWFRGTYGLLLAALIVYLVVDTAENRWRLVSFVGLIVFLLILIIFSTDPRGVSYCPLSDSSRSQSFSWINWFQIDWRPVFWGLGLQFVLGLLVLRWSVGNAVFTWLGNQFSTFLSYTQAGTVFVYGWLVTPPNICGLSPVFAFSVSNSKS